MQNSEEIMNYNIRYDCLAVFWDFNELRMKMNHSEQPKEVSLLRDKCGKPAILKFRKYCTGQSKQDMV